MEANNKYVQLLDNCTAHLSALPSSPPTVPLPASTVEFVKSDLSPGLLDLFRFRQLPLQQRQTIQVDDAKHFNQHIVQPLMTNILHLIQRSSEQVDDLHAACHLFLHGAPSVTGTGAFKNEYYATFGHSKNDKSHSTFTSV